MMDKHGFDPVSNDYSQFIETKLQEARKFITQFANETGCFPTEESLNERIAQIEHDIRSSNMHTHT